MPAHPIPERTPICDPFTGVIVQIGAHQALALSPDPETETIASGAFVIRYGVRFLQRPGQSIVPGLVVLDYGDMLTGEEAWNFLWHRSNLHPRAEVVGHRSDGGEDMVFFKTLDLSLSPEVLVYTDAQTTIPLARPTALITTDTNGLPTRLLEYLPIYATVEDWTAA
ncbi:MAG TPA: hypothetical protein VHO69_03330 [Phototrophicaceae bacterium]|nr:hypothetical protein [Phototrophicaceae bacterium]